MNIGAIVKSTVTPNNNDPSQKRIAGSFSGTLKAFDTAPEMQGLFKSYFKLDLAQIPLMSPEELGELADKAAEAKYFSDNREKIEKHIKNLIDGIVDYNEFVAACVKSGAAGMKKIDKLIEIILDPVQGTNVLVGGTTRSGKSTWQTAALVSLTSRFSQTEVALLVVDGKRTEFTWLNGSSHLLLPIAREPEQTLSLLEFAYEEMVNRQEGFGAVGARNLVEYNEKSARDKKPIICLFADELGNVLNALEKKEKETADEYLNQISSQGIAAGIFLIPATQKPVADDIPSKTKSNCSTRICFRVEGYRDSMVVLNATGGENLLGAGDLLAISPQIAGTQRLQALFIETPDISSPTSQEYTPALPVKPKLDEEDEPGAEGEKEQLSPEQKKELFDEAIERVADLCRKKNGDVLKARELKKRVAPLRKLGIEENADAIREYVFPEICRRFPDIKPIGEGNERGIFYEEISNADTDT